MTKKTYHQFLACTIIIAIFLLSAGCTVKDSMCSKREKTQDCPVQCGKANMPPKSGDTAFYQTCTKNGGVYLSGSSGEECIFDYCCNTHPPKEWEKYGVECISDFKGEFIVSKNLNGEFEGGCSYIDPQYGCVYSPMTIP